MKKRTLVLIAALIGCAGIFTAGIFTGLRLTSPPQPSLAATTAPSVLPAGVFPIAVWDQSPQGGDVPAPYTNQAQAFKAMGVNTFVGLYGWPENATSDNGEYAAATAAGMYVIAGSPSTAVNDIIASNPSYFLGYQLGDEPGCTVNVASQVAAANTADPSHLTYENEGAWVADLPNNDIGNASCLTQAEANLVAPSIVSYDDYALTDPWHDAQCEAGNPTSAGYPANDLDCGYLYGQGTANAVALAGSKPVWTFVETGTDDLGLSSQNGGIGEYRNAPPAAVNSAAWDTIIHGSTGLEWFCDDTLAYDACAGGGGAAIRRTAALRSSRRTSLMLTRRSRDSLQHSAQSNGDRVQRDQLERYRAGRNDDQDGRQHDLPVCRVQSQRKHNGQVH